MKSKPLKSFLSGLILSSAIASIASAEETNQSYMFLEAGLSKPGKAGKTYPIKKHFKNSPVFGIGAGYRINENLRADFSVNYRSGFKYTAGRNFKNLDQSFNQKVKSLSGMINAYYDIGEFSNIFKPYVGAGLGIARNKAQNFRLNFPSSSVDQYGKTKTNFAWQVGTGSLIKIDDNINLNIGYRYVDLGTVTTKTNYATSLGRIGNETPIKSKLTAHEFVAGVTFSF
jgi:opacity protein-like surface antigen